jgi:hypothetical protein
VFIAVTNRELSSKLAAFDELVVREREAQNKLQALGNEKKMLSERDYSSSAMISSTVAHAVALLKSYMLDLDIELLHRDYPLEDDDERDTLLDSVYDIAHHFVSQYDFSIVNDQDDMGSPST